MENYNKHYNVAFFIVGFACAVMLIAVIDMITDDAVASSTCGNASYNPCYVRVVK